MAGLNERDVAARIAGAVDDDTLDALGILERVFGREGDHAIAAALAYWALSDFADTSNDDVDAVADELFALLQARQLLLKRCDPGL